MTLRPKQSLQEENTEQSALGADSSLQIKVWLMGISRMVWGHLLVPAFFTLCELHGVIQVTMGCEGIHLSQFRQRATRYGSVSSEAISMTSNSACGLRRYAASRIPSTMAVRRI